MPSGFPKVDRERCLKEDFYAIKAVHSNHEKTWFLYSAVVVLRIPKGTMVMWDPTFASTGTKFRSEKAEVLAIFFQGKKQPKKSEYRSIHDQNTWYKVGRVMRPSNGFSMIRYESCAPGIHFYIPRKGRSYSSFLTNCLEEDIQASWDFIQEAV